MDKTQLKRHDLIFVSRQGKDKIWRDICSQYSGARQKLAQEVLQGSSDVPGFVRRCEEQTDTVPLGFVHYQRIEGNRIRIGAFTDMQDIVAVMTPYEVMQRKAYAYEAKTPCMAVIAKLYALSQVFDLQVGVLGSAALELLTALPYTDAASDIDLLIKPAPYDKLLAFYKAAQASFDDINMDFELDLPNGYGVKLAEIFMETQTVLGKSLVDVNLLSRKEIMQYLQ